MDGVVCRVVPCVLTSLVVIVVMSVSVTLVLGTELIVFMRSELVVVVCCWFRGLGVLGYGRLVGWVMMTELK